jgi:hypothetical protein
VAVSAGCGKRASEQRALPSSTPSAASAADDSEAEGTSQPRPAKISHELTDARRQRIEQKLGEVRGFLVESELEEQMKRDKKIDRRERALESFDGLAKDRWVLFVGPMINLDAEGFQMAVAFIPESRRDKMAVTRLWFNVTIAEIKGYRPVLLREGQETAVLARYQGNGQASPAYDLVGIGLW